MRDVTFCTDAFADDRTVPYSERFLACLLWALIFANESYLIVNPRTPTLYNAGVRWEAEKPTGRSACPNGTGQEKFLGVRQVIADGKADCEDVASYRVADVRLGRATKRGLPPRTPHPKPVVCLPPYPMRSVGPAVMPAFYKRRTSYGWLYHIVVAWPDGTLEDPSRVLGMGGVG